MMVGNTGLESLCEKANTADEMISAIKTLMKKEFKKQAIEQRKEVLAQTFDNTANARRLVEMIYL